MVLEEQRADPDAVRAANVPDTLEDAIRRRVEGLSEPAQSLLGAASVIGRDVDLDSLGGLSDEPTTDIGRRSTSCWITSSSWPPRCQATTASDTRRSGRRLSEPVGPGTPTPPRAGRGPAPPTSGRVRCAPLTPRRRGWTARRRLPVGPARRPGRLGPLVASGGLRAVPSRPPEPVARCPCRRARVDPCGLCRRGGGQ